MTKTFEDLEAKVEFLEERLQEYRASHHKRLHDLEVLLHGDAELRAKWEAGKPNYPNINEPPPGALAVINAALGCQDGTVAKLRDDVQRWLNEGDTKLSFVRRLEKFFGPMLDTMNPPLDGAQVATKAYVDTATSRIAGTLREEIATAFKKFQQEARSLAHDVDTIRDAIAAVVGKLSGWSIDEMRKALREVVEREENRALIVSDLSDQRKISKSELLFAIVGRQRSRRGR